MRRQQPLIWMGPDREACTLFLRTSHFRGYPMNFIERTVGGFLEALERALYAEELARAPGLLQRLDPRLKLFGILALIVAAAVARNLWVIGASFGFALLLSALSRVPPGFLARRVWIPVFLFTGVIAAPALFLVPGQSVWNLPWLHWPVTVQGIRSACYLLSRVETAATLSVLTIVCTPWSHVLKALRVFRVPVVCVVILGMTYRYIFLLLHTAHDMFESRRSRLVGRLPGAERRRIATASVGVLMSKSLQLSDDVYSAMQSRGFQGEAHVLHDFHAGAADWIILAVLLAVASGAFYFGR
jgi:cobalt/nickel transport system permease protein